MRRLQSITFVQLKRQVSYSSKIGPSVNQLISGEKETGWANVIGSNKYSHDFIFPTGTDGLTAPEVKRLKLLKIAYHRIILSSCNRYLGL